MSFPYTLSCAVWEFTLACNLDCIHCGSSAGSKREKELDTDEALKLCDDLKAAGCGGVALMGGEPFLRGDFWAVASKIRELGMELSVITNGTVRPKDVFSRLKALSPRAVAVSIDAAEPALHDRIRGREGAFADSWSFMNDALAAGLPVSVITTVHKLNLGQLAALREKLKGKGLAWQVQTAGAEGRRFPKKLLLDRDEFYAVGMFIESTRRRYKPEDLALIGAHDLGYNSARLINVSLYEKWEGCQAGVSILGIRSDGGLIGCLAINDDRFVEGNARTTRVKALWRSRSAFPYTRNFRKADAGPECAECRHLDSCKGGCSEMSLMKTGRLHNDPYCFYAIERADGSGPSKMERLRDFFDQCSRPGSLRRLSRVFSGRRRRRET